MENYLPTMTIAVILAFLAPLAVSVVTSPAWPSQYKRAAAIAASVLMAVVALAATGGLAVFSSDPEAIITTVFGVIGVSQTAYALIWKPSGVAEQVEKITTKPRGEHVAEYDGGQ